MIDSGVPKDDPRLLSLNELRHKSINGELIAEEVKEYRSLTHELAVEHVEQAEPRPAVMVDVTEPGNRN